MTAARQQVPVTLVCGFLGAGKTTFLRAQLADRGGPRTAVLVNDFGDLGFDGGAIRGAAGSAELAVVEMAGGCICCSAGPAMADTVRRLIRECRPERLYIEPSGVAEASELVRILQGESLRQVVRLACVVTVVDAETLLHYLEPEAFGSFFRDQIACGDVILVNRMDLVAPAVLTEILARLAVLNPSALVLPTAYGAIPMSLPARGEEPLLETREKRGQGQTPISEKWEYFGLAVERSFTPREIEELGRRLTSGECGTVLRAKGVIPGRDGGRLELQLVGGRVTVSDTPPEISARFTCIGLHLDRERLASCFTGGEDHNFGDSHERT